MLRLFVAVDLPHEIRDVVARLRTDILGVRWVKPSQLHITLRFMGEIPEATLPAVVADLEKVRASAFPLALGPAGTFPSDRKARVLWLGLDPPQPIHALENEIARVLSSHSPASSRTFTPHLTLARLTTRPDADLRRFLARHADFRSPSWPVEAYRLYRSTLRPNGALHEAIAAYALAPTRR